MPVKSASLEAAYNAALNRSAADDQLRINLASRAEVAYSCLWGDPMEEGQGGMVPGRVPFYPRDTQAFCKVRASARIAPG